jgi:disulfide bond formation protein DsbB
LAIALAALGSVAFAVTTQHLFDMQPCPWCILQRLIYVSIGLLALIGLGWSSGVGGRAVPYLLLLLCGLGIATALWQHFVAAASASCNLTLADRIVSATGLDNLLPEIFQPRATCADAAVDLLGVPFELWSAAMFTLLAATCVAVIARSRRLSAARR